MLYKHPLLIVIVVDILEITYDILEQMKVIIHLTFIEAHFLLKLPKGYLINYPPICFIQEKNFKPIH